MPLRRLPPRWRARLRRSRGDCRGTPGPGSARWIPEAGARSSPIRAGREPGCPQGRAPALVGDDQGRGAEDGHEVRDRAMTSRVASPGPAVAADLVVFRAFDPAVDF